MGRDLDSAGSCRDHPRQLPDPGAGFRWDNARCGLTLRCLALDEVAEHFVTTRGLAGGGAGGGDDWPAVAETIGVPNRSLVRVTQVHGRRVLTLDRSRGPAVGVGHHVEADALASDDDSVALAVRAADCVPILLADPRTGAVGVAHAGWRGTVAGVAGALVDTMQKQLGVCRADLIAAIAPSIGPCCYDVGPEVRAAFEAAGYVRSDVEHWFQARRDGGLVLDLWLANEQHLIAAGVPPSRIHVARLCTASHVDLFPSYRREAAGAGRLAAVIRAAPRGKRPRR